MRPFPIIPYPSNMPATRSTRPSAGPCFPPRGSTDDRFPLLSPQFSRQHPLMRALVLAFGREPLVSPYTTTPRSLSCRTPRPTPFKRDVAFVDVLPISPLSDTSPTSMSALGRFLDVGFSIAWDRFFLRSGHFTSEPGVPNPYRRRLLGGSVLMNNFSGFVLRSPGTCQCLERLAPLVDAPPLFVLFVGLPLPPVLFPGISFLTFLRDLHLLTEALPLLQPAFLFCLESVATLYRLTRQLTLPTLNLFSVSVSVTFSNFVPSFVRGLRH